jgi:hypothetical protein
VAGTDVDGAWPHSTEGKSVDASSAAEQDHVVSGEPSIKPMSESELEEIANRASCATPGPWHVRQLDDDWAQSLVAVSTVPDTGHSERWPDFDHTTILAATLVQHPRYVDIADERWDENAIFIAHARVDVPRLIDEVRRLRRLLSKSCGPTR